MSVYLLRNYGSFTASTTIPYTFQDDVETALIAQGLATAGPTSTMTDYPAGTLQSATLGGNIAVVPEGQTGRPVEYLPARQFDPDEHRSRLSCSHELRDQRCDADRRPVELQRNLRSVLEHLERRWSPERNDCRHEQVHRRAVGDERSPDRQLGDCRHDQRWRFGDAEPSLREHGASRADDPHPAGPLLHRPSDGRCDGHHTPCALGERLQRDLRHAGRDVRHGAEHHDRLDHVHDGRCADLPALHGVTGAVSIRPQDRRVP
jgi:hypothetical protein